ncbi:hypothetical protein G9C85_12175 [Halorubellus sp. JP-L1]|uniref:hypothetical protein n=1 Tax=Halorubellus sp. JP-L1 TaxID=2715753 RepID=UPI00140942CE|nr:hypothetical protein [Halorubellus sp. JP-L1]NHN42378.1 hypothetical protein [Halorubellus sp. JP-L1]
MSETEVDPESLQEELGQIKEALGLAEEHPYWWRFWLLEGVGLGVTLPVVQVGLRDGFSPPLLALAIGLFLAHQFLTWRALERYDRPTGGVPSWRAWNVTYGAGAVAAAIGLLPVLERLATDDMFVTAFVVATAISGVAYLYMGQLLASYNIRAPDCYAFYTGGVWLLVLAAVVPHIPPLLGWEFAVLGIGLAAHNVGAYVVLSRV